MWREKIRRLTAVILALALAAGLVTHNGGNRDFVVKPATAAAAADMPMNGNCDGCGGDDEKGMQTACAAYCGVVFALPATAGLLDVIVIDVLSPSAGQDATGYIGPPDPYPPRPIDMS
jgi:hypothetical protein